MSAAISGAAFPQIAALMRATIYVGFDGAGASPMQRCTSPGTL